MDSCTFITIFQQQKKYIFFVIFFYIIYALFELNETKMFFEALLIERLDKTFAYATKAHHFDRMYNIYEKICYNKINTHN